MSYSNKKSMADHNELGKKAEDLVAEYLVKNGYTILVRNFRFKKNEIDIIAEKDNKIVVVEVKARSTDFFILPQEAVTKSKIKAIVLAANHFMEEFNKNQEVRFDIISVLPDSDGQLEIEHIQDAFEAFDAN
ncbi:YraN family protein [Chryseobacterium sp. RR2-3-20]|uniref:YraN family protein n=1 Tax=Chryseobacterium sp. RR2-3-20 TaxID=2787626 RepID=UPI00293D6459|nr:YraN family protein [Chryseobacterium sp. RR2-3-20]